MLDKAIVDKALATLTDPDSYRYFFQKINSIEWFKPLLEKGFFKDTPPAIGEGGVGPFPDWPESQYLKRIVSKATDDQLQKILCDTMVRAEETNNVLVHEDFANIALALPNKYAEKWAKHETEWLINQNALGFAPITESLVRLSQKLAEAGCKQTALELMKNLLNVKSDPEFDYDRNETQTTFSEPNPRTLSDAWHYTKALKQSAPWLAEHTGLNGLRLIRNLLCLAIRYSLANPKRVGAHDFSFLWRPAIEDHEQNRRHDGIRDALIDAVRGLGETLIPKFGKDVLDLIEEDRETSYKLFLRIGLYLRREFFLADRTGTETILSDPSIYDDTHLHHEVYLLLKERFGELEKSTQDIYYKQIREHQPDLASWLEMVERETKKRPTADVGMKYVRRWIYDHLQPISRFLDEDRRREFDYEALESEFPERGHPEFSTYMGQVHGPISPLTAEEFAAMNDDKLIEWLRTWKPVGDIEDSTQEGLATIIQECVPNDPQRFARLAERFRELPPAIAPPYVRSLITGFREIAKKGLIFDWLPVFSLCRWIVEQPIIIPNRRPGFGDMDRDWGPTWASIAGLIQAGFKTSDSEIPYFCREALWPIIVALSDLTFPEIIVGSEVVDPKIKPDLYRSFCPDVHGIRREGLDCVVRYALWLLRHMGEGHANNAGNFSLMPEVRELLDRKLVEREDWAPTFPEPFGRWFPWLLMLDREWSLAAFGRIFPTDANKASLRAAAWIAYMNHTDAYDTVFDLMRSHYIWALEQLGTKEYGEFWSFAEERLSQEIMIFYWRGRIGLNEPDRLLELFFEKASSELRQKALSFIGMSLRGTKAPPGQIIQDRLEHLWEWWFGKLKVGLISDNLDEIGTFADWFASGKLNIRWSLDQIKEILRTKARSKVLFLVLDRLVELATEFPTDVVECIGLLVEYVPAGEDLWMLDAKDVRKAFESVVATTSDKIFLSEVDRIINRLGALGYPWISELRPLADELRKHLSSPST